MKLTIQNFRGIPSGEYDLAKGVTLIAGENGAGKTSLCQAIASLARGPACVPLALTKKDVNILLHNGATGALLELRGDNLKRAVQWPSGKCVVEGEPFECSEVALGLRSLCDSTADTQSALRERAAILADVLQVEPTQQDLSSALDREGLNFSPKNREATWDRLQQGDAGWTQAKERGQRLKGEWQGITHQTWGSREGSSWLPEGYAPDLDGASEDTLAAAVVAARQEVEALLQSGAVNEVERARLELICQAKLDDHAIRGFEQNVVSVSELVQRVREKAHRPRPARLAAKPHGAVYRCAYTDKLEMLADGELHKVEEQQGLTLVQSDPLVEWQADPLVEWQADQAALATHQDRLMYAQMDLEKAKARIREADDAAQKLAAMPAPVDNSQQIKAARIAEKLCQQRLDAWQAKTKADRTHRQILTNQSIVKILSPEGLRAEVLSHKLTEFNAELARLSDVSKWPAVILGPDFLPRYGHGKRQYRQISESEQFRVRVTLQVAIARREKAPMLVIDRCDILDRDGRRGLFALLNKTKIPAVIAMTMNEQSEMPDLSKWGGRSHWIGLTTVRSA